MKKTLALVAFVLLVCFLALDNRFQFTPIFAQSDDKRSREQIQKDRELASTISELTNRDQADLVAKTLGDDQTLELDLNGGFQNIMLARAEETGETTSSCVTSLAEANSFFGRNLETGDPLPRTEYPKESLEKIASRHGMSAAEFELYTRMISDADEKKHAADSLAPQSSTITIVNLNSGSGQGFDDSTAAVPEGGNLGTTLGAQRLNVFQKAAEIWGDFLDSNVPVNVNAQFSSLTCTSTSAVLGSAGTTAYYANFANAPLSNTWYHYALANKISRSDRNGSTNEINANFNSNLNGSSTCLGGKRFYLGYDNSTPSNTTNLLIVVLHELAHGLGSSSRVGSSGTLSSGIPDIWTRFMYDDTVNKYWYQMTDAERAASAVNNGKVYWDGASVKMAAAGYLNTGNYSPVSGVLLYMPATFQSGSSISHFDTSAAPNLLMEPSINTGLPLTLDLSRQQMRDIGWYRDTDPSDTVKDAITTVSPSGGSTIIPNSAVTISWANVGGFNKNVSIELSTDGGASYSTVIASNIANTGSYAWAVPDITTTQGRIRVHETDFADPVAASTSNFSILTPTAAAVTVSGRVMSSQGRGIRNVQITLTDVNGNTRTARTTAFGYYRFNDVTAGETVVLSAKARRFKFNQSTIVRTINESITDADFVGQE